MNPTLRWAVPLLALPLAPPLAANAAPPEPGAAASAVAPYHSAFADYKPWSDIAPGDWRRLNAGAVASPMAGMSEMHDIETPTHSMAAMRRMSTASQPSHDHSAMHGSAGAARDARGGRSMPGMQGMSPPAAPAASTPRAGHSTPGGRR